MEVEIMYAADYVYATNVYFIFVYSSFDLAT